MKATFFTSLILGGLMATSQVCLAELSQHRNMVKSSAETVKTLMKNFKSVFRSITSSVSAGKLDEKLLADVALLKDLAVKSKELIPQSFDGLNEDHRQHLIPLYKEEMQKFIDHINTLEVAIKNNNAEEAKSIVKTLAALKDSSHDSFEKP